MKRDISREDGATLVEFALILPVFMSLILGMFTGGLLYNQKLQLTHAAREGARYGATLPEGEDCTIAGTTYPWDECVQRVVLERTAGDVTNLNDICVALVEGSAGTPVDNNHTTTGTNCFNDGGNDTGTRVQISVKRLGKIEALFFTMNVTLTSRATAQHES